MPALNTTLTSGPRDHVLSKSFYDKVCKKHNLKMEIKEFNNIIITSNEKIQEVIADDEGGFKFPEQMGYMVVTKYKSKKLPIDWVNSKKLKKKVCLPNLHSFGFIHHIKWFRMGLTVNFGTYDVYKFEPCRDIKRRVAANVKKYKVYHSWTTADFWTYSKTLKRILNKK